MDVPTPVPVHMLSQLLVHAHQQLAEKGVEGFNVLACDLGGGDFALMTAGLSRILSGEVLMFVGKAELASASGCIAEVAHGLCEGSIDFLQPHTEGGARLVVVPQMLQPTMGEGSALIENIVRSRVMIPPTFFEVVPLTSDDAISTARDGARLPLHADVHFLPHGTLQEFREMTGALLGAISGGQGVPDIRQVMNFLESLAAEEDERAALEEPEFYELDLDRIENQRDRPAPYEIPGFGPVTASAQVAEIGDNSTYEGCPEEVQNLRIHFHLPEGTVASQMSVVAYIEGDEDVPSVIASRAERALPWLSTIFKRDYTPLPVTRKAWGTELELEPDLAVITGVWIAPAFAEPGFLRHMIETVDWIVTSLGIGGSPCLTIELAQLDKSFDVEPMSDALRTWYDKAIVDGVGALRAGRVDHNWATDDPPQWCDHHGPYYLIPRSDPT
jgi:hypothetical protein